MYLFLSFFSASSAPAQDNLGSALYALTQTCQSYLDSGNFEKAERELALEYVHATTEEKKVAISKAYREVLKLKEFSEAFATEPVRKDGKKMVVTEEKTATGSITHIRFE